MTRPDDDGTHQVEPWTVAHGLHASAPPVSLHQGEETDQPKDHQREGGNRRKQNDDPDGEQARVTDRDVAPLGAAFGTASGSTPQATKIVSAGALLNRVGAPGGDDDEHEADDKESREEDAEYGYQNHHTACCLPGQRQALQGEDQKGKGDEPPLHSGAAPHEPIPTEQHGQEGRR
jgi:hypothetical protein